MNKPLFILPRRREWKSVKPVINGLEVVAPADPGIEKLLPLIGGKAAGLFSLEKWDLPVPAWGVITTVLYSAWQQQIGQISSAGKACTDWPGLPRYRENLHQFYRILSGRGRYSLAVRSSATVEDSLHASYAGQFKSVLHVTSFRAFLKAAAEVLLSLERGTRIYKGSGAPPAMALVVQRFIQPLVSGVAFSLDPLSGNRNNLYIQSLWGQGEGLVSGKLEGDSFLFDAFGREKKRIIVSKERKVFFSGSTGGALVHNPRRLVNKPSLNPRRLGEIYRTVRDIQKKMGIPVDVEFLFTRSKLFILQLRPVTAITDTDFLRNNFKVWDNSNIVESYAGITLPLTFSYIQYLYSVVYKEFFKAMYIPGDVIRHYQEMYPRMLGYIKGRVYYNLINWYLVVSELPGFKYNKGYMELMMGVSKSLQHIPVHQKKGLKKYLYYLPRSIWTLWVMVYNFFSMPKKISVFVRNFYREYNLYKQLDLSSMNPLEILDLAVRMEEKILFRWKTPIINDIKAMIYYGILKKLTVKWFGESNGNYHNTLLTAQGDMISLNIVRELESLAKDVKQDKTLKILFTSGSAADILKKLKEQPSFRSFYRKFEQYLEQYGFRSVEELKLEAVPNKANPLLCITMLKNYLKHDTSSSRPVQKPDTSPLKKLPLFKRMVYSFVLKQTKQAIKDRETQRFCRAQIFDFMRSITERLARLWQASGIIRNRRDIYYLTIDEIRGYIQGTSVTGDLMSLIELRKEEFRGYEDMELPHRFTTYGEVCHFPIKEEEPPDLVNLLQGEGCSPGVVEGRVIVLEKPDIEIKLDGEIVAARQTDPGWVILYPAISGLLVEKGSMLSHSAIVAREMKVPTIVGIKGLCKIVKNGQRVRMDGALGTVEILG